MSADVEVNLRIPRAKVPSLDERGYPIDNSSVRFTKLINVPTIPKPGVSLQLTTSFGNTFECEVTRADWHEEKRNGSSCIASIPRDRFQPTNAPRCSTPPIGR